MRLFLPQEPLKGNVNLYPVTWVGVYDYVACSDGVSCMCEPRITLCILDNKIILPNGCEELLCRDRSQRVDVCQDTLGSIIRGHFSWQNYGITLS